MKKIFTRIFFVFVAVCGSFLNVVLAQPKNTQTLPQSQAAPTTTSKYVPFSGPENSMPDTPDQVNAAPPPPVETPISGIEFLIGGGVILGAKRFSRFFSRKK